MLISGDDDIFVDKNREYFSDEKSVVHLPRADFFFLGGGGYDKGSLHSIRN